LILMKFPLTLLLLAAVLLTGCQTARPLYYWGNYEPTLYLAYRSPEQAGPAVQAGKLEQDLAKAAAANLQPNPGLHAQLGYAYYQLGRIDAAQKEFAAEKALFPESAVFIDRMLAKLEGKPTS
jgi:hypothetical protein